MTTEHGAHAGDDTRKQLREARQLITSMARVCRQTQAFLQGISAYDQNRMKQVLRDAIKASDKFLGTEQH